MIEWLKKILALHFDALALREQDPFWLGRGPIIVLAAVHLAGLAAFWRLEHQPIWFAVPLLVLLLAFPFLARRVFAVETLAPLFFLYAIIAARYVAIRVLYSREPYVDEASLADPRLVFFQLEVAFAVSVVYVALVQIARYVRAEIRPRIWVGAASILLISALAWFAAETIGHRTRGATASDPYVYAQMAVDIATHGTPLHSFPLFNDIANLKIAWYPIEHVGYRLFSDLSGNAPSVWPIGGSYWIAAFYDAFGEEGLYLATPVAALAALVAFGLFVWEYLRDQTLVTRAAVAAISVALLATSWEMVDRSIVPLVDAQAQLFTVLSLLIALCAARNTDPVTSGPRYIFNGILVGISLAVAYHIRHTQVLVAIPILLLALHIPGREKYLFIGATALSALFAALPDLYYHHLYFGGWLTPESNELDLFSLTYFFPSALVLSDRFFAGNEFGYLIPFLLYGIYRAARDDGGKFSVIATWVLILVAFHLPYIAIKMRDLLPEFPGVIFLTAYGMFALARDVRDWAGAHKWRHATVPLAILIALLLPSMRTRFTIQRPFQPVKITFGYVTVPQRSAYNEIAALTPVNAIVSTVMNDGPIDLYAHRATIRAGVWTPSEREIFLAAMKRAGREVFLLEDGSEMSSVIQELATRYELKKIKTLDVPLFGDSNLPTAVLWEIQP